MLIWPTVYGRQLFVRHREDSRGDPTSEAAVEKIGAAKRAVRTESLSAPA